MIVLFYVLPSLFQINLYVNKAVDNYVGHQINSGWNPGVLQFREKQYELTPVILADT